MQVKLIHVEHSILAKSKMVARLMILNDDGSRHEKSIHFGQRGAEDYTVHKDEARKTRYIARHSKREDWTNPLTKGFWAKNILWNLPTIRASIADTKKRFF